MILRDSRSLNSLKLLLKFTRFNLIAGPINNKRTKQVTAVLTDDIYMATCHLVKFRKSIK